MDTIVERSFKAYPEKTCTDFSVDPISKKVTGEEIFDGNGDYRVGYIKCAEEYESLPKIRGWVARNLDNTLLFHSEKPIYKAPSGCWVARPCEALQNILWLNKNDFPEITPESEPVEVELLIRKV